MTARLPPRSLQELLETFHAYTARLVRRVPLGSDGGGSAEVALGPLAAAALGVAGEAAAAAGRMHEAMSSYARIQVGYLLCDGATHVLRVVRRVDALV